MAKEDIKVESMDDSNVFVYFSEYKTDTVKVDPSHGYLRWGKKNDFPQELIRYFDDHAEHGAIVGAKSRYMWGYGPRAKHDAQESSFLEWYESANRYEGWDDIGPKIALDCELFNGFFIQVISDLRGNPSEYYHLQYANCRLSPDGKKLFYSDDWTCRLPKWTAYNLYEKGKIGVFFLQFKFYSPSKNKLDSIYPKVPYNGCLQEIKSDIDITIFDSSYVENGFSAGTIVSFFNGEPKDEQKRRIRERFNAKYGGPTNAGGVIVNYVDKGGQAAQVTSLSTDDLDKKFEFISSRYQQKIITGHNVTNPELFGIKTEGQLGTRVSLRDSHELFINTYTKPRQNVLKNFLQDLYYNHVGIWCELEFEQLNPIGYDILDPNAKDYITKDEAREALGLSTATDAGSQTVPGQPGQEIPALPVNSILTKLSGKEQQALSRIVRYYNTGKYTRQQALMHLQQGFQFTPEQADQFLGAAPAQPAAQLGQQVKMGADKMRLALDLFDKYGRLSEEGSEILFEEEVHIHDASDAAKYELRTMKAYMADTLSISVTELDSAVLNALKGNPTLTVDQAALETGVDVFKIEESIARLTAKGLVENNASGFEPTERAYDKSTEPVDDTEIITVYKYALKANAPALLPGGQSREYCREMLEKSKTREWTFEDIDSMTNELGENAWDYRGGFYTNPQTGKTDPYCRHIWKAITKVVKKKK